MGFNHLMALWLKGKEFDCDKNMDGTITVYARGRNDLYAVVDPEKREAHYYQTYPEPVITALLPVDELKDLQYFVSLLIGDD